MESNLTWTKDDMKHFGATENPPPPTDFIFWVSTLPRLVRVQKLAAYFRDQEVAIQVNVRKVRNATPPKVQAGDLVSSLDMSQHRLLGEVTRSSLCVRNFSYYIMFPQSKMMQDQGLGGINVRKILRG